MPVHVASFLKVESARPDAQSTLQQSLKMAVIEKHGSNCDYLSPVHVLDSTWKPVLGLLTCYLSTCVSPGMIF